MQTFRYKPAKIVTMLAVAPLHIAGAGLGLWGTYTALRMTAANIPPSGDMTNWVLSTLCLPLGLILPITLFFAVSRVYLLAFNIGMVRRGYVKVTDDYIEVSRWPEYHVRCSWDKLEWARMPYPQVPAIHLTAPETVSVSRFPRLKSQQWGGTRVSLNRFQTYPDGALGDTVRRLAPQLFAEDTNK